MTQLHLFPEIIRQIELEADSPKKAFYRLMIEECRGRFTLIKESGASGHILDTRRWEMPSREKAEARFNRIVKSKLNPARGSPRKYKKKRPTPNEGRFADRIFP